MREHLYGESTHAGGLRAEEAGGGNRRTIVLPGRRCCELERRLRRHRDGARRTSIRSAINRRMRRATARFRRIALKISGARTAVAHARRLPRGAGPSAARAGGRRTRRRLRRAFATSSRGRMSRVGHLARCSCYAAGSIVCHQIPERSFHIAGVQLPVCARCTGLYAGALAGVAWLAWSRCGAAVDAPRVPRRGRAPDRAARDSCSRRCRRSLTVATAWLGLVGSRQRAARRRSRCRSASRSARVVAAVARAET